MEAITAKLIEFAHMLLKRVAIDYNLDHKTLIRKYTESDDDSITKTLRGLLDDVHITSSTDNNLALLEEEDDADTAEIPYPPSDDD